MNRRGFLGSILALGAAPAIVRADSLMRIVPRETLLLPFSLEPLAINYAPALEAMFVQLYLAQVELMLLQPNPPLRALQAFSTEPFRRAIA